MDREEIVAVALLSQRDVDRFGSVLQRIYPVDEGGGFEDLLRAMDAAEERHA